MGVIVQTVQVSGLVMFNIVMGFVLVRGIVHLVAKLTDEQPRVGCIGLPAAVMVAATSAAIWILVTA